MSSLTKSLSRGFFAVVLILALAGCGAPATAPTAAAPNPASALQKVAAAEVSIAQAVGALQSTVIKANGDGLISDDTTRTILQLTLKISQADAQAVTLTQNLNALDPAQRKSINGLFAPISQATNDILATGLVPIKDPATLAAVRTALIVVQSLISGVQLITGA